MKSDNEIMEERINLGTRAKNAYETYLKDFITARRSFIAAQFSSMSFDVEALCELKRSDMAISDLEATILNDISVGQKTLEVMKKTNTYEA